MNEKTDPKYWDNRVLESKGDPQALVYASAGKLENCQRIGDELIRMIVKPGQRFLDVGCGFGRYYPAVKAAGGIYMGIDFSEEMIKEARKRHPEGDFICADWNSPGVICSPDIVFESICHSSTDLSIEEFIDKLIKKFVFNDTGRLIIVEPNVCGIFTIGNIFNE